MTHKWQDIRKSDDGDPERRRRRERYRVQMEVMAALGRLQEMRQELAITQEQVAKMMGVTQTTVSDFERSHDPRLSTLIEYAGVMLAKGGNVKMSLTVNDEELEFIS